MTESKVAAAEQKAKQENAFRPDPKAMVAAREAHAKRPKGVGGGKSVRHKAIVFPSVNVSAMRFSSIMGHSGVSLGDTEKTLRRLGIVSGGKTTEARKGPTASAVRMRHSCRQLEWAMPKRMPREAYDELADLCVEIRNRACQGNQDLATISREMGLEVRYLSGGDEG